MLTVLLACPMVGMLIILALPKTWVWTIRMVALLATGFALLITVELLSAFNPQAGIQFQEHASWIPQLNVFYHLGLDGLNLPMIFLTALLGFLACLASFSIHE